MRFTTKAYRAIKVGTTTAALSGAVASLYYSHKRDQKNTAISLAYAIGCTAICTIAVKKEKESLEYHIFNAM